MCREAWGFESPLPHQTGNIRFALQGAHPMYAADVAPFARGVRSRFE
jgi:hypothetical protein